MSPVKMTRWLMLMLLCCCIQVNAQDEKTMLKAERIKADQLPPEVLAAYKKKFQNANLKDIVKLPMQTYKADWQIDEVHQPTGNEEYYSLTMHGDGIDVEALYDKKGNLIRANEVATNIAMPTAVSSYIVTNYKGYAITKDKVKRLIEPNQIQAEWEVEVVKGSDKKRLLFDKEGKFKKEK